jgi:hypothetical protein
MKKMTIVMPGRLLSFQGKKWAATQLLFFLLLLSSCAKEKPLEKTTITPPKITLAASKEYVAVDELTYDEKAVEFKWTKPNDPGAGFRTVYLLKIDIADNDFRTAIVTDTLNADALSKSFTHKEIQRLLVDKWGREPGKEVDLEAKVVAIFLGPYFIPSEIKTIRVKVKPFAPMAILADRIWIQGDALATAGGVVLTRAVENQDLYAYYGELNAGKIVFPLEYGGKKELLMAADVPGDGFHDGDAATIRHYAAGDEHAAFTIPAKANYRVVVNVATRTVTIYSPAKDKAALQANVYMHGPATSSNWTITSAEKLTQSVANPNIWTYYKTAAPLKTGDGRIKFVIERADGGFAYSAGEASTNITAGTAMTVFAGRDYRNNYYKVTQAGISFIVLDLEKLTVLFAIK